MSEVSKRSFETLGGLIVDWIGRMFRPPFFLGLVYAMGFLCYSQPSIHNIPFSELTVNRILTPVFATFGAIAAIVYSLVVIFRTPDSEGAW